MENARRYWGGISDKLVENAEKRTLRKLSCSSNGNILRV